MIHTFPCVTKKPEKGVMAFIEPWSHNKAVRMSIPANKRGELRAHFPSQGIAVVDFHYPRHRVTAILPQDSVEFNVS